MTVRGFILQPTYRIDAHRPVVHLHGVLESGEPFLIRDDRATPHFYIRSRDTERAVGLGAESVSESNHTTLDGHPATRVAVRIPSDTPALRDRLTDHGIVTYEADVRFAMRYLMQRGIRGSVEIAGDGQPWNKNGIVFDNPEVSPADWTPTLAVLSLDIETDPRAQRLLSIALHGCGVSEVLLYCPDGYPPADGARPFATEADLLRGFAKWVRQLDPDVLTGWNVVNFDFDVLARLAKKLGVRLNIGRGPGALRMRPVRGPGGGQEASIPGRVVLDGIRLLRGAFIRMDAWGLDAVAQEVLGEGKTMSGGQRGQDILDAFMNDRARFVAYNRTDARLVIDILEKLRVVELAVERSKLTGMPIDRVAGSIASFDFLYLSALHRRKVVAPSVRSGGGEANLGGHVLEPETGLYRGVLVYDFQSLYPSLIRTFQIDPLGFLPEGRSADGEAPILAPNGAAFRRDRGILTEMLDELFPRRAEAKAKGDEVTSHAIKILMNSFYGVLGTTACRFYEPMLAGAITSFGRTILLWTKARFESYGHRVLYGDTDSLFVLPAPEALDDRDLPARLAQDINRDLDAFLLATWNVESRLELELEKRYLRLLLPTMRGSRSGARKRYAGLRETETDRTDVAGVVEFTGMESVRRDWTELAKVVQRELYERLFRDRPVDEFLDGVVKALRAGERDGDLVYRKALRKPLDAYTATTPPHVAAARKLEGKPPRVVRYLITKNGPEPLKKTSSAIDHEHYVQKQIRPVAEPVLGILGLDFDKVIGDDAQMTLF